MNFSMEYYLFISPNPLSSDSRYSIFLKALKTFFDYVFIKFLLIVPKRPRWFGIKGLLIKQYLVEAKSGEHRGYGTEGV